MSNTTYMYNIIEQNKYGMRIERVENIEDAGDDFITWKEGEELGLEIHVTRPYNGNAPVWSTFDHRINDAVLGWVKEAKAQGNKGIVCTDEDLIQVLTDQVFHGFYIMDYCVFTSFAHVSRNGNRFNITSPGAKKKKAQTKPKRNDWFKLVDLARRALSFHCIEINYGSLSKTFKDDSKKVTMVKSIKKIVTWKDMVKANNEKKKYFKSEGVEPHQLSMIKKIWDKPSIAKET